MRNRSGEYCGQNIFQETTPSGLKHITIISSLWSSSAFSCVCGGGGGAGGGGGGVSRRNNYELGL